MVLRFTYESFFGNNTGHFLLQSSTLQLTLVFNDNSQLAINVPPNPVAAQGFTANITAAILPDVPAPQPAGGPKKKQIVQVRCRYSLRLNALSKTYELLRIVQHFSATPGKEHADDNPVYTLAPSGWLNRADVLKTGNMATHPLVKLDKLSANEIRLNTLIVHLSELWKDVHANNFHYDVLQAQLGAPAKVAFEVFGNLSGNAFIWYASVPSYLGTATSVAPHVFFAPSDNAELQNNANEQDYLLKNDQHFLRDGRALFKYLWPPVADTAIPGLPSSIPAEVARIWRNVVGFAYVTEAQTSIGTKHWKIPAGFDKAFYGEGGIQPKQFLLLPQNVGEGAKSIKGIQVLGPDKALKDITDTIALVLQTNTNLLATDAADKVGIDRLVLSAYSESGFDLWWAIKRNPKGLKAVIAIEPQNLNTVENDYGTNPPTGKDVLPALIKEGSCKIFMIGRHHTPKYKPDIPDSSSITFLPARPAEIFKYPPDPASNPFVRYRVERMTNATLDPLMTTTEKDLLGDLAAKNPSIAGLDALKSIFHRLGNVDCTCAARRCECTERGRESWYSHQYALSGGQVMQLPASGGIYNQPITYKSFFHEAMEQIG